MSNKVLVLIKRNPLLFYTKSSRGFFACGGIAVFCVSVGSVGIKSSYIIFVITIGSGAIRWVCS